MITAHPRRRRTWPQRFLLLLGPVVAGVMFAAAFTFWEARTVLADLPRIRVGADVLAQSGDPGDPLNFLLVGVDSAEGLDPDDPVRDGRNLEDEARGVVRPDTILVMRLDPATGQASVLSLPRDLIVDVPGGTTTRINATQAVGGLDSLISTIDSNFAIPINHFVVADFAGFAEVVEIVGGVPVNFPFPTRDLGSGLRVDAGCWALDGSESLAYVRSRSIEELIDGEWVPLAAPFPDLARIARQQEFLVLALEQVLSVARSDVSRIGDFIDAGSQAVQIDENLTPGDMLDLASAFSDLDTEALEVSTLPVSPLFSEAGVYQGESLVEEDSLELLAIFQGLADGVRPDQVTVSVASDESRHVDELSERGFVAATSGNTHEGSTAVTFDPELRDQALLLTRYLESIPALQVVDGASLELGVGPDFSGIRQFPRPARDVEPGLDVVLAEFATQSTVEPVQDAPTTTAATPALDDSGAEPVVSSSISTEATTDLPSTSIGESADRPNDPTTIASQTGIPVVRGRPPAGVVCGPTGG